MVRAIKTISVERGRDPADFALLVFGGAGPIHAVGVARDLGIRKVIIPPSPGVFSAFGLLRADVEQHASRTILMATEQPEVSVLQGTIVAMTQDLTGALEAEGYRSDTISIRYFADLRYRGQSSEITIGMSLGADGLPDLRGLESAFEDEFERTYGYRDRSGKFDVVTIRALATVRRTIREQSGWDQTVDEQAPPVTHRRCYFGADWGLVDTPVIRRSSLSRDPLRGPLIIQEYDTHIVSPPQASAAIDEAGNLIADVWADTGP
jgi:N-methylhydantoinase A